MAKTHSDLKVKGVKFTRLECELLTHMLFIDRKIAAIKRLRDMKDLGIKECKEVLEKMPPLGWFYGTEGIPAHLESHTEKILVID